MPCLPCLLPTCTTPQLVVHPTSSHPPCPSPLTQVHEDEVRARLREGQRPSLLVHRVVPAAVRHGASECGIILNGRGISEARAKALSPVMTTAAVAVFGVVALPYSATGDAAVTELAVRHHFPPGFDRLLQLPLVRVRQAPRPHSRQPRRHLLLRLAPQPPHGLPGGDEKDVL